MFKNVSYKMFYNVGYLFIFCMLFNVHVNNLNWFKVIQSQIEKTRM